MKGNKSNPDPDPEPPELRAEGFPTLKKVWKSWAIGVGSLLIVILIIAIIFHSMDY